MAKKKGEKSVEYRRKVDDETIFESWHVRVLPSMEASGSPLEINVTILSKIEGSIRVSMNRKTTSSRTVSGIMPMDGASVRVLIRLVEFRKINGGRRIEQ